MIRMLKGWVDDKVGKLYMELEEDHKELKKKYKELQDENEELLKDYSKKVEEVNELKMEKISRENPNFYDAEKKENLQ